MSESSPRPWGCFLWPGVMAGAESVFPTPVGVFLILSAIASLSAGLPHARGGVSNQSFSVDDKTPSSPRPWGCFVTIGRPVRI